VLSRCPWSANCDTGVTGARLRKETQKLESLLVNQASNTWKGLRLLVFFVTPFCLLGAGYYFFISNDEERLIIAYLCIGSPVAMLVLLALASVSKRSEIRFVIRDHTPIIGKVLSVRSWTHGLSILGLQYSHNGKEYSGKAIVEVSLVKSYGTEAPILVSNRNPKRFLLAPKDSDGTEKGFPTSTGARGELR
jgi:hypothetical protein